MQRQNQSVAGDNKSPFDQPAAPLRSSKNQVEASWMLQIPNQEQSGKAEERAPENRCIPQPKIAFRLNQPKQNQQRRHQVDPARNSFGPRVKAHAPVPGN